MTSDLQVLRMGLAHANGPADRQRVGFGLLLACLVEATACAHGGSTYTPPHPLVGQEDLDTAPRAAHSESAIVPENKIAKKLGLPADARRCYDRLWYGGVTFELVRRDARGVEMPIRVTSPIGGIWVQPANESRVNAILDCRLALRLLTWAPTLRRHGVRTLEHYSAYRPNATIADTGKRSAHADALALDLAKLHMDNGDVVEVLSDWEGRERGEPPCPRRREEGWASRTLRTLVCDAIDRGIFQVVLTPHYDKAHQNHVHLELRPRENWTYVR